MKKAIYFDMDGTLANLYSVNGWLDKLRQYDTSPYAEAQVMLNMQALAHRLNALQRAGYTIGVPLQFKNYLQKHRCNGILDRFEPAK